MSLRQFRVEFERPTATYTAGETVRGKIILDIAKEKTIRGLVFFTKGESRVHWTETESVHRHNDKHHASTTRQISYNNSEEYFTVKYNIVGSQRSDSRVKIEAGYHEYQFSFQLPHNIPSSFEHEYGHIRYTLKAVIDRPWKFDHQTKCAFTVVSMLDLNAHREKCIGIDDEIHKQFHLCCCFCTSGELYSRVRVPISGYVPGQTIDTTLDYRNLSSSVQMTKMSVKLLRALTFHARTPHRKQRRENVEIKSTRLSGPFPTNGQSVLDLLVPPIPPSNLEFCNIIELEYELLVTLHVNGMHRKLTRSYPILIGTIPLHSMGYNFATIPMPMPPSIPSAPPKDSSTAEHPPLGFVHPDQPSASSTNWNIPPPSYEECVSKADNIKDHDDSSYVIGAGDPFAPRYPVFNYPVPSTHRQ